MSSRQPQSRAKHAAVGVGRKLFVWGGESGSAKIQTTTIESFDVISQQWDPPRQIRCPLPDGLMSMAVATDGESAFFFGGSFGASGSYTYSNKLYLVDLSTLQCRELVPRTPSRAPKKVSGCAMVYFNQKLVVYGGYTGQQRENKLYVFDMTTSELGQGDVLLVSVIRCIQ